jgi:hypothetical protein
MVGWGINTLRTSSPICWAKLPKAMSKHERLYRRERFRIGNGGHYELA